MTALDPRAIGFGREDCGELDRAESLEWLVTNGLGGFASGTIAGIRTRRYHGFLIAALAPPAARTVVVTDLQETLTIDDLAIPLHASRWQDGAVDPRGFEQLEAFWLEGQVPVWRFVVGAVCLERRVVMARGCNTTVISYRLVRAPSAIRLGVKVLTSHRDFHAITHRRKSHLTVTLEAGEIQVRNGSEGQPLRIRSADMELTAANVWYEGFQLRVEQERGQDALDDALHAATATVELALGAEVLLVLSTESGTLDPSAIITETLAHERDVLARFQDRQADRADAVGARLALAADQFLVERPVDGGQGASVIAGYHWFGDWGRDTMIALPGLTLATGRPDVARQILATYSRFVDGGMLPNRFPDRGGAPEYNTVDATLWYLEAIRAYVDTTHDLSLASDLWPVLEQIVAAHEAGTRYGIGVDSQDGLLRSGEAGVQLTWMDAKFGDWVVTPRQGKCVEINALWYNALMVMTNLAVSLGREGAVWRMRAERVRAAMQRFWSVEHGYLLDVLDGPQGDDSSLRPNQLFAVSLPASALDARQQRAVVDACARSLLTSHGLRSLAPDAPAYRGRYEGDRGSRDAAYHQGTVWAWLLGPFALAHHRVYGDAEAARALLDPLVDHLRAYGIGSIAEIFDGSPPHRPRGCIAQAWSVAELLRAWTVLRVPIEQVVAEIPSSPM
ncbi:MAG: amylo-alpha-1,6-glucosidase [Gemmatimonadota bacterium]